MNRAEQLGLDFIDVDVVHTLTKLKGNNNKSIPEGYAFTGLPHVVSIQDNICLLIYESSLNSFQTSAIIKVEVTDEAMKLHTLNSVYDLRVALLR